MVEALQRLGFTRARQRGSHVVMRQSANGCVVPLHRAIKRGALAGIVRQTNISAEEFLRALP